MCYSLCASGALHMTLQDAAAVYNELIRELSLNLMLHQTQT
jgi:hypothetical protein